MIDVCCGMALGAAGAAWAALRVGRRSGDAGIGASPARGREVGRGVVLHGAVWPGGDHQPYADGAVLVDADGRIAAAGPAAAVPVPQDLRVLGGPGCWIGPCLVDAHVHQVFAGGADPLASGLIAVRDLGAPPGAFLGRSRFMVTSGPIVTAPGGYPSTSWGSEGFAVFADSPARARSLIHDLVSDGAELVKVALEPAGDRPVPSTRVVAALVAAAHDAGLPVVAHALTAEMVGRALDARVDELVHTPAAPLDEASIERIAAAGVPVVSTLQTFQRGGASSGTGRQAARNAALLLAAGVPLIYGTDLGNAGTRPGVDPRELDRLAATGLGRLGALRAATGWTGQPCGIDIGPGVVGVGEPARLVLLPADPLLEPEVWRVPLAVLAGTELLVPGAGVREFENA
jgi:imidazolonepropionase-like amidohydrolase